jgi:hypothetical protein
MIPYIPVSIGELVDKISILEIKKKYILDAQKQININNELRCLYEVLKNIGIITEPSFGLLMAEMIEINEDIWHKEDKIHELMRRPTSDQEFIDVAFAIHAGNDARARHKLKINRKYGSTIVEEKSHEEIV